MTNEQLAVLLEQFRARLEAALAEADASLPEGVEREVNWEYVRKTWSLLSTPLTDPDDWKECPGVAMALAPIREVEAGLEAAVEELQGTPGDLVTNVCCS